ncbi:MAG TPA: DNA primase [Gammaproteobacteria bacterium]
MGSRIPRAFKDELLARADIVEVVGARVTLKRAGANYKALCPFHGEKTPSFIVSPSRGTYHCFGCGVHGNAIDFLMQFDNLSYPEAVEALAESLGLEVPREAEAAERRTENDQLYDLLREADQIYRAALREHPEAIEYLKRRGIDGATAGRFAMGYAPDAWDTVLKALGGTEARMKLLLQAGLLTENEQGRRYDRFRNRIMFPIRDNRGRVIGFGGRVLDASEPKYLNSPETPIFHKREALYGLYEARRQARPKEIYVVEGYLDVASLAQHGVEPVVATLGTATTPEHIRRLTRLAERIVFCFDGDRAGRAAAWRAMETALPFAGGTVELKFLLLPEGEDPDSLVRKEGADAFRARAAEALPLSTFLVRELEARAQPDSADGRARLAALARPLLERLPDGVYRELLTGELAAVVGMPAERFAALVGAATKPTAAKPAARPAGHKGPPQKSTLMRKAIRLALHYPRAAARVDPAGLEEVDQPGAALLKQLLEIAQENPHLTPAAVVERFRDDPLGRHLGQLLAETPLDDEAAAPTVLEEAVHRIVRKDRERRALAALREHGVPPSGGTH